MVLGRMLLPLLVAFGCGSSEKTLEKEYDADGCWAPSAPSISTSVSDSEGFVVIDVPIGEFDRSFQINLRDVSDAHVLGLDSIIGPDGSTLFLGEDWLGNEFITDAVYPRYPDLTMNWPMLGEDGPLVEGNYQVKIKVYLPPMYLGAANIELETTKYVTKDLDGSKGCVDVRLVFADGLDSDEALVSDVNDAVAHWKDLYAAANLLLRVTTEGSGVAPDAPSPNPGNEAWELLKSEGDDYDLVLVLGDTVDGNMDSVMGQAGGIPGQLNPGPRAVVVVSWLMHAGITGTLSDDENLTLGETMAHEVGHYMGLLHPVQFDEDGNVVAYDAIPDTETCRDYYDCADDLGGNMMFPYTVCDYIDTCEGNIDITEMQESSMQLYSWTK